MGFNILVPLIVFKLCAAFSGGNLVDSHCSLSGNYAFDKIENALSQRRDDKNNVILLGINRGFADFAENWLCSVQALPRPVNNFLFLAEDVQVYELFKNKSYPVYFDPDLSLPLNDTFSPAAYGQLRYQVIIHKRVQYILKALKLGYHVLLADVDAVWLDNPFQFFDEAHDVQAQADGRTTICGGFIYLRNTTSTLALWSRVLVRHSKNLSTYNFSAQAHLNVPRLVTEQALINNVASEMLREGTITTRLLDISLFPAGKDYFVGKPAVKDTNTDSKPRPIVVHNNWIIGHGKKKSRFHAYGLWFLNDKGICTLKQGN